LNIASLKDSGDECASFVDQLSADLLVVSGNITGAASGRQSKKFNIAGAVLTFPELESSSGQLSIDQTGTRPATPCAPAGNPNPDDEGYWTRPNSLTCVPRLTAGPGPTDFPSMTLKPNWRDYTDGRLVFTRGTITGMHPSDWTLKHTTFAFRRRLANPTARFQQRITDRIRVTATIPSNRVEINLVDAVAGVARVESAFSSIVIEPTAPGRPVRLKLLGRHDHTVSPALKVGDWVDHFCAFYALFDQAPAITDQLIPRVGQISVPSGAGQGQPSPGGLCPGMWWP
jgi:hypothetical protein